MQVLIVLLPLLGALLAMPLGRGSARTAEIVTTGLVFLAALLAWWTFFAVGFGDSERTIRLFTWIAVGDLTADWAVRVDALSATMMIVVTTVSSLVHLYSIGYMSEDPSRPRFFAYLSLFTFAMLMLVTADNLLQLFFGWEGVGLASYLLIGFWHHKSSANDASIKAFVMNRVGDVGLALGIMACFLVFRSVEFDVILETVRAGGLVQPYGAAAPIALPDLQIQFLDRTYAAVEIIGVLLFIGAMGKSAQFLLHTWLPDAMEGPTPVSALIHAATMVTAGVFLVCRMSDLYAVAPGASALITVIGATTAIYAATVGLVQPDIKRVIAYSTASQLGYMFFAAGVGGYGAAMFHLTTHAFFKALLFLGAGAVIHFSHHEQDMRFMGGLRQQMPITFLMMLLGTLAITGVGIPMVTLFGAPFGFAGFVSKDMIIESAFAASEAGQSFAIYAFVIGLLAATLTAFYSWRLIFLTFGGKWRAPEEVRRHPHGVPSTMIVAMLPLAVGAVLAGMLFYKPFVGDGAAGFWEQAIHVPGAHAGEQHGLEAEAHAEPVPHGEESLAEAAREADHGDAILGEAEAAADHGGHHFPAWVLWAPFIAMVLGTIAAWFQYSRGDDPLRPGLIGEGGMLYGFLRNRWYIDDLYRNAFLKPARLIGRFLWKRGDEATIDRFGPNGLSALTGASARGAVRGQSGYVFHYAFVMLIGVTILLLIILL
ncbi:NADH-quinone oxidoreductase subunit L [Parvularcula oceani]|uniref:NADH-quinone oxidoreductase subunit L n=1 Tax=Parvularcula oceani TaxID=1247963 RepID=UPI0004E14AD3|nr:NADH-quinone oxidoreductase subunit L [Parvularcula oceani]